MELVKRYLADQDIAYKVYEGDDNEGTLTAVSELTELLAAAVAYMEQQRKDKAERT